jgi:ABC-type amino acid transport system permease subunit
MAVTGEQERAAFQTDVRERTPIIAPSRTDITTTRLYKFPWWALALLLLGIWIAFSIALSDVYSNIFQQLRDGIGVTLQISVMSYFFALILGLVLGLVRSVQPTPRKGVRGRIFSVLHLIAYNVAMFFVEVMRGLPMILVLLLFAYVLTPEIRRFIQANFDPDFQLRGASMETAIIGLSLAYGAFLSEIFRAGIQSIDKGQVEAARSLGMNYLQAMMYVVLPQAIRRVLPPLGNDFIAMIKDSSLVVVLAVRDVTQIAKLSYGASFLVEQTFLVAIVIYLTMTLIGSLLVKLLERYLSQSQIAT